MAADRQHEISAPLAKLSLSKILCKQAWVDVVRSAGNAALQVYRLLVKRTKTAPRYEHRVVEKGNAFAKCIHAAVHVGHGIDPRHDAAFGAFRSVVEDASATVVVRLEYGKRVARGKHRNHAVCARAVVEIVVNAEIEGVVVAALAACGVDDRVRQLGIAREKYSPVKAFAYPAFFYRIFACNLAGAGCRDRIYDNLLSFKGAPVRGRDHDRFYHVAIPDARVGNCASANRYRLYAERRSFDGNIKQRRCGDLAFLHPRAADCGAVFDKRKVVGIARVVNVLKPRAAEKGILAKALKVPA